MSAKVRVIVLSFLKDENYASTEVFFFLRNTV